MPVVHKGKRTPEFREKWDPSDREYVWFCWADKLDGATIVTSEWTLPANWTSSATQIDQSVTDEDGVVRSNCNGNQLSTTETFGDFTVTNKVTLSDGRIYERSVIVPVMSV